MKQFSRKKWPWIVVACMMLAAAVFFLMQSSDDPVFSKPTLIVETPQKLSAANTDEIVLDVTISELGKARYPAMSMSLRFDSARLEFLGVEEGNLFVYDDKSSTGQKLPDWSYNVEKSNEKGIINIMYLDMTGGKHAFSEDLLAENENVVLRLKFRLRGSVRSGDVLDLILEDAVFAASDEIQSLAMTRKTLKTKNGQLVIGD